MTYIKNMTQAKCEYPVTCYSMKVWRFWERLSVIGSVAKMSHFVTVPRFTYDVISRWPDLKMRKKFITSGLSGGSVMPSVSSLSQTAPEQLRANRLGWFANVCLGRRGLKLKVKNLIWTKVIELKIRYRQVVGTLRLNKPIQLVLVY